MEHVIDRGISPPDYYPDCYDEEDPWLDMKIDDAREARWEKEKEAKND